MSTYTIQRFDGIGRQESRNINGSGGAVVMAFVTSSTGLPERNAVVVYNPSTTDSVMVRIAASSVTDATTVAATPIFAVVAPGTEKAIACGRSVRVWLRSSSASGINNVGVHEVF